MLIVKLLTNTKSHRRTLILDVMIDGSEHILVNIYNANTESKQLKVLNNLNELIKKFHITPRKQIVLARGYNFFDTNLKVKGGEPIFKKNLL